MTENGNDIEFHIDGRGGRVACVSGWSRDGYFCLSVNQEDLTLHAFMEAVRAEFPNVEGCINMRDEDGAWIASGRLEAAWQERHYSTSEKATLIRNALDHIQEKEQP